MAFFHCCTFLFVLLTSFVSPTVEGFIGYRSSYGACLGIDQNAALYFADAPRRLVGKSTEVTPLQAETGTRRLGDESDATSQGATLVIRGTGTENQACTDCALGIYNTSSCDEQAIADADTLYDKTKFVDNPWVNATYTIDENGDIDYEVTFDHGVKFEEYRNTSIVLFGSAGNPVACGVFELLNETCASSGGTVTATNCSCADTRSFPETCGVGACTCPPGDEPNEIGACECPQDACFDGIECISVEAPTDAPVDAPVDAPTDAPTSGGFAIMVHFVPTTVVLAALAVVAVLGY